LPGSGATTSRAQASTKAPRHIRTDGIRQDGQPDDASSARVALAYFCILVVWGTTYLAIAIVLRSFPPFLSAGIRFLLASSILYGWLRLQGPRPMAGLPVRTVVASGILMCGFGNGFTVFAIQGVPTGAAALVNSTIPICVTLLDWWFFNRRRPRVWTGIGLAAGIAGVALIVHQASSLAGLRGAGHLAALAIAIVTWSVGTLLQRHAVPREKLLALGCGQMAAGSAFLFLAALVHGETAQLDFARVALSGWLALLYLVVFGSLLAQTAYLWLLARRPAEKVTTYAVVNPVIALLLGAVVLGEPVTPASALGALLVLGGVALVLFERNVSAALGALLNRPRRARPAN
jgi:drug/metabolite transporter (DMT)-like permease